MAEENDPAAWEPRTSAERSTLSGEIARWRVQRAVTTQEFAARILHGLMLTISDGCWCAGWYIGLEHILWDARENGPRFTGLGWVSAEQCNQLRYLSEVAGGWWWFPDEAEEEVFVDVEAWSNKLEKEL